MLAVLTALILNLGAGPADREHHASLHPLMQCMVLHIAEMVEEDGDPVQRTRLMIRDLDGANARILHAPDGKNAQEARWSPDGDWIAFVGGPDYEVGSHSFYVIQPDGSDLRRVAGAEDGLIKSPYWTADSQALVFEVRHVEAGYTHIDRIDLATGHRARLTEGLPGHHQHPRISPDGASLLVSWRDAESGAQTGDLFVYALDHPGHRTQITHPPRSRTCPPGAPMVGSLFTRGLSRRGDMTCSRLKSRRAMRSG